MKRAMLLFALSACFWAAGCGGVRQDAPPPEAAAEDEHTAGEATHASDDLLRIDPAMLRDLRITTALAESRSGGEAELMPGELRVNEDAYAEVAGPGPARVVKLLASPGERIRERQVLAELESVDLGRVRADLLSARARLNLARQTLARTSGLVDQNIAPRRALQEAEREVVAAEAEVASARAALLVLGIQQSDQDIEGTGDASRLRLLSPITGTVLDRSAVVGQMTDSSQPLFRVADLSSLWLVAHAGERDAVRVNVGASARVGLPALPGRAFTGRVSWIGSQVDPVARTIPVRIVLPNEDGKLRPGMTATAWVPLGEAAGSIVTVPTACLQRLESGWFVFIPRGEGAFEKRAVGRGRDLGGEIEILSGVAAGEAVVVEGAFLLKAEAEKARGEGGEHDH